MNAQCNIHTMNPSTRNRLGEAKAEENLKSVTPSESKVVHLLSENSLHTYNNSAHFNNSACPALAGSQRGASFKEKMTIT